MVYLCTNQLRRESERLFHLLWSHLINSGRDLNFDQPLGVGRPGMLLADDDDGSGTLRLSSLSLSSIKEIEAAQRDLRGLGQGQQRGDSLIAWKPSTKPLSQGMVVVNNQSDEKDERETERLLLRKHHQLLLLLLITNVLPQF